MELRRRGHLTKGDEMETKTDTGPFPVNWHEWRKLWASWLAANEGRMARRPKAIPGKNFLADEILGTWKVNGRVVELSELTFPNLHDRDETGRLLDSRVRRVGITFADDRSSDVVGSFADLERVLF